MPQTPLCVPLYAAAMERTPFTVPAASGELSGWLVGDGPRVLAVHGGPGMNYDYLDAAVLELAARFRVATFQQRGLAPSTLDACDAVAYLPMLGKVGSLNVATATAIALYELRRQRW